jgi:hypothetical protein
MNRDFGVHFAAWFVLGTLVILISGFGLKPAGTWLGPGSGGAEMFCYSFLIILSVAAAGALLDVIVVGAIVDRIRHRHHKRA